VKALAIALFALLVMEACADSIRPEHADAGPPTDSEDGSIVPTGKVTTVDRGNGVRDTLVDATSETDWTYLDLDTGREDVAPAAWDLGFKRQWIESNGGVSGTAGVEVAILTGVDFDGVIIPPTTGWATDAPDGDDPNPEPDYVLKTWYDYDEGSHVLSPKAEIYAVRTSSGAVIKLQILDYYDPAGTSAWFLLRWAVL
jgi:hypothetical protein